MLLGVRVLEEYIWQIKITSQDVPYSRINASTKANVMADFTRLPYTENIPYTENTLWQLQFARIHTSSLIKIKIFLNGPITKFYNIDDVNVIAAELWLTKTRSSSFCKETIFYKKQSQEM